MPNNNKKTRGGHQQSQSNPGVGHESSNNRVNDSSTDRSQGNSDRGNQGMGDHGTSRRSENIDSGTRSNNR